MDLTHRMLIIMKKINQQLLKILILFLSFISLHINANNVTDKTAFKHAYKTYIEAAESGNYTGSLTAAKTCYSLSKKLYKPLDVNRLASIDNYAVNLMVLEKNAEARVIFEELLESYEHKYGKHDKALLPILNDLSTVNAQLEGEALSEERKALEQRKYKLYLRHNSTEFVEQFADPVLPTTIHTKNLKAKLDRHFDKKFKIQETDHWSIIHLKSEAKSVKKIAKAMEKTYKNNISFLVAFNLRNKPLNEKMTAVYFHNKVDYISYISSIRDKSLAATSGGVHMPSQKAFFVFNLKNKKGKVKLPNYQTLVHEATHQILYNAHFSSYSFPRWLSEGIAAAFEHTDTKAEFGPHTKNSAYRRTAPLNRLMENGEMFSLSELIAFDGDDEEFSNKSKQIAVYAGGAMLVRFLYQYYPDEFRKYLTVLSKSRTTYYERAKSGKNIRVKQFKKAFGKPELLDEEFYNYALKVVDETKELRAEVRARKKKNKMQKKTEIELALSQLNQSK